MKQERNFFDDLLVDPRPELKDSELWTRLFRKIPLLEDKPKAEKLLRHMWSMRAAGTMIKYSTVGIRLEPIFEPFGLWDDRELFDLIRRDVLAAYAKEISSLLNEVMEEGA